MTILTMMTISIMMTISKMMTIVFERELAVVHKEVGGWLISYDKVSSNTASSVSKTSKFQSGQRVVKMVRCQLPLSSPWEGCWVPIGRSWMRRPSWTSTSSSPATAYCFHMEWINLALFWLKLNKMCKFFNSSEESLHLGVCKLAKYVINCVVFLTNLHSWQKFYTTAGSDKF